ncbi:hypothetical protein OVA24_16680 [Luteolibacter sp. SL250]|uniref:hypothetical protein n=1 Tax=Luteolibacter sp. SL250 TaxID=2995170 RepID=UPI00226DAFB3|nr:hypothetical protein [Luteolibacter sp. SL250]WAC18868.1 hypothetical protein OVA24_16680 [Luteolibacter sp. SL250]
MNQLTTHLRHLLTGLAGIGTYLATLTPVDPATVTQINDAGKDLVDPLAAFFALLAIVAVRLVIAALGKVFPSLGERLGNAASGGMSGGASVLLISMAAAVGGLLPSCADYPMTGGVFYRHPESGAKAGLTFEPGKPPSYTAKVPVYAPETGKLTGWAEVSGPLAREVKPEK